MSRRAASLALLAVAQVLAAVAVRNEALAARARAEAHLRLLLRCEEDRREQEALEEALCAPEALSWRMQQKKRAQGRIDL